MGILQSWETTLEDWSSQITSWMYIPGCWSHKGLMMDIYLCTGDDILAMGSLEDIKKCSYTKKICLWTSYCRTSLWLYSLDSHQGTYSWTHFSIEEHLEVFYLRKKKPCGFSAEASTFKVSAGNDILSTRRWTLKEVLLRILKKSEPGLSIFGYSNLKSSANEKLHEDFLHMNASFGSWLFIEYLQRSFT